MATDRTKKHHYIPQGILSNFSNKRKIWWYSKKMSMRKNQNIGEVAYIKHFYRYPKSDNSLEIEFFTKIDSDAPEVISKILKNESIPTQGSDERHKLIKYIASQLVRTPQSFYYMEEFEKTIKEQIHPELTMLKEDLKTDYLNSIVFNTSICEEILNKKLIYLYKADKNEKFIIGDSPVLSFNRTGRKNADVLYHAFPPVVNYDMYFFPISEDFLLVFINNDISLMDDIFFYIRAHNDFQFINSSEWIFSKDEKILEIELKKYNDNCYNYINLYRPILIGELGIIRGNDLVIAAPVLKLDENTRNSLRGSYMNSLKNKNLI